ncbi:TetR/AcrR family transcriptional regulator [Novosphingobium sp. KCTC 2891]|uniref:TetR/AcrR family transcriptional regulator n=1 Tax=Novosphingobium sp. KCTC 2891 TaxID=2989730 RepID=UPI002222AF00|nr:TetR/AcrR family transcriptional regulator [Novosphingobium sp. KCTC 2891]MCW1383044.1 TetR/AcrR family transcriptional regulator [Novosphingobium sp. KCTC 2891]
MTATALPLPEAGPQARPKKLTSKGLRTRSAILDAAERQFAERGFEGVSLRQIMDEAHVQMGQVQYYFPTKEEVFASVLERRLEAVCAGYAEAMAHLDALAAAGKADLRAAIRAVTSVSRTWLSGADVGRHRYLRMLALSTMSFDQPDYVRRHGEAFRPLNERVVAAMAACFPNADEARVRAAYHLIEANLLSVYVNIDAMLRRSAIARTEAAVGALYDDLEDFLHGGVERMIGC